MLRISKLTDYGVVLTTHLASRKTALNVRDLASETGIPQPTVSKVLKRLARHGVVTSQRGSRGGYGLARPAETITVAEVIASLEGPIAVTECSSEVVSQCDLEHSCGVRATWQRINLTVHQALRSITLADMVRPALGGLVNLARSGDEAERIRSIASDHASAPENDLQKALS